MSEKKRTTEQEKKRKKKLPYFMFSRQRGPGLDHIRERFEVRWPLARLNQVERLQRAYLPILKKETKSVEGELM